MIEFDYLRVCQIHLAERLRSSQRATPSSGALCPQARCAVNRRADNVGCARATAVGRAVCVPMSGWTSLPPSFARRSFLSKKVAIPTDLYDVATCSNKKGWYSKTKCSIVSASKSLLSFTPRRVISSTAKWLRLQCNCEEAKSPTCCLVSSNPEKMCAVGQEAI